MNIIRTLALLLIIFSAHAIAGDEHDHGRLCLALVGYSEARNQGDAGMLTTMHVVLKRATDPQNRWPKTICEVVMQRGQFSGVERWAVPRIPPAIERATWNHALDLADVAIAGSSGVPRECLDATSFDKGAGAKGLTPVCKLRSHIFYTESRGGRVAKTN